MHLAAGNTSLQQGLFNIQQPHRDHMIFETLSDGILVDDAKTLSVHWQLKMTQMSCFEVHAVRCSDSLNPKTRSSIMVLPTLSPSIAHAPTYLLKP
jgi:hypothetical protein